MRSSIPSKLLKTIVNYPQVIAWGPFKHAQGYWLPYYFNFRGAIALLKLRQIIVSALAAEAKKYRVDVIAGAETAGLAWGAWVADKLNKPFVYVRKERKHFLNKKVVEGIYRPGARAVLIDDTLLLGNTKRQMIKQTRRDGLHITHILLIYISGQGNRSNWRKLKKWLGRQHVKLSACVTRQELSEAFLAKGVLTPELLKLNSLYMADPYGWPKSASARRLLYNLKKQRRKYE